MVRPSLSAHNSASNFEVAPIFLEKPITQLLDSSLIIPPTPTSPRLPKEDPLVFNFLQPLLGFSHLIFFITKLLVFFQSKAHQKKSLAWRITWSAKFGLGLQFWKINLFLCCHIIQMAKRKTMFQGGLLRQRHWSFLAFTVTKNFTIKLWKWENDMGLEALSYYLHQGKRIKRSLRLESWLWACQIWLIWFFFFFFFEKLFQPMTSASDNSFYIIRTRHQSVFGVCGDLISNLLYNH